MAVKVKETFAFAVLQCELALSCLPSTVFHNILNRFRMWFCSFSVTGPLTVCNSTQRDYAVELMESGLDRNSSVVAFEMWLVAVSTPVSYREIQVKTLQTNVISYITKLHRNHWIMRLHARLYLLWIDFKLSVYLIGLPNFQLLSVMQSKVHPSERPKWITIKFC